MYTDRMHKDDSTIRRTDIQDGVDGWKLTCQLPDGNVWQQPQGWYTFNIHGGHSYFIGRSEQELNEWLLNKKNDE